MTAVVVTSGAGKTSRVKSACDDPPAASVAVTV